MHQFDNRTIFWVDLAPAGQGGRAHFRKITSVGYHEVFLECVAPLSTTDFSSFGTATGTRQPGRFPTLLAVVDHYDTCFTLGLTPQEKNDLVQFVKSR